MKTDLLQLSPRATWQSAKVLESGTLEDITRISWEKTGDYSKDLVSLNNAQSIEDGRQVYALFTHPKWSDEGTLRGVYPEITLPQNAMFEASVGFSKGATQTDGVTFEVWKIHQENGQDVSTRIAGTRKGYTGRLKKLNANLSHLSGQKVKFELRVNAGPSSGQDWAVWTDVNVYSAPTEESALGIEVSRIPKIKEEEEATES